MVNCPICRGDMRGEAYTRYFCSRCFILFSERDLVNPFWMEKKEKGFMIADP